MSAPCEARDTGICACADCTRERIEARLRDLATKTLHARPGAVTALVYRSGGRWRASIATRDGEHYARTIAATPDDAARGVLALISGATVAG